MLITECLEAFQALLMQLRRSVIRPAQLRGTRRLRKPDDVLMPPTVQHPHVLAGVDIHHHDAVFMPLVASCLIRSSTAKAADQMSVVGRYTGSYVTAGTITLFGCLHRPLK